MAKSVIPGGAQACSFSNSKGTFVLDANLVEWSDTRKSRVAIHEYLKRDGAKTENMGRAPFSCKLQLFFVGQNWLTQFKTLAGAIDADPDGDLVHPAFGKIHVTCQGFDGAVVNVENAVDMYTVPISFIENGFDQTLSFINPIGLASAKQQIDSNATDTNTELLNFATALSTGLQYTTAATSFATSLYNSVSSATLDPTIYQQLADVKKKADATRAAVLADPAASGAAVTYDALAAIEQLYATCLDLQRASLAYKPQPFLYTVPAPINIAALAARFYGKDGRGRINEILTNNPGRIPNPAWITQGTILILATPTNPNATN